LILKDYNGFGFNELNSGTLRNVLEYQGVVAPHTGEPFTDAMLFGIGGGVGVEY
jgi:hypothetical protein